MRSAKVVAHVRCEPHWAVSTSTAEASSVSTCSPTGVGDVDGASDALAIADIATITTTRMAVGNIIVVCPSRATLGTQNARQFNVWVVKMG